jgi:asparagine synthase (glutamine-hydrolysing)
LLLRGPVRSVDAPGSLDLERVAEELRCQYLEHGYLAVEGLEGSFTIALLDGQARRILLYRNLVGNGHTYYHAGPGGLLFSSNLAHLLAASRVRPELNQRVLPALFLFRTVPGAETLVKGFSRLLPGEQICWDARGLTRLQRHGFADLQGPAIPGADALASLQTTLREVLGDYAAFKPETANLLSGGVDSSYLQVLWNQVTRSRGWPRSYSLSVDHPQTWPDTDYAITASRALGTRHTLIPADDPYEDYLLDTLVNTAEMPNHVQSAYFGHLARTLVACGVPAGLCGEGADSLFGLALANQLHNAAFLREVVPGSKLRRLAAWICERIRWPRLSYTFWLSNHLGDLNRAEHPINSVAVFADLPAVEACFGREAIAEAFACRRALLDRLGVPADPMDRLHAAGFLGEAVDSAALWTTLFNSAGADLLCPFLDSRVLRLVTRLPTPVRYRFRRPKALLKRALTQHAPRQLTDRPKLGFGQPIFAWLRPGGQLHHLVEGLGTHPFVDRTVLQGQRRQPTWFLYTLLCFDCWHRHFLAGSPLPRGVSRVATARQREGGLPENPPLIPSR